MSLTCWHRKTDAYRFPDCGGCRALLAGKNEADLLSQLMRRRMARPSPFHLPRAARYARRSTPLMAAARAVTENLPIEREFDTQLNKLLGASVEAALSRGFPDASLWIEDERMPGNLWERRLMTGADRPNAPWDHRLLARAWLEREREAASARDQLVLRHEDLLAKRKVILEPVDDRDAELAAGRDAERPGVWLGVHGAQATQLTQEETDVLIRLELWTHVSVSASQAEQAELRGILGQPKPSIAGSALTGAFHQRGGIDSDPLVRLLAWRAWGNRDRRWPATTHRSRSL